jgi:anion transporter
MQSDPETKPSSPEALQLAISAVNRSQWISLSVAGIAGSFIVFSPTPEGLTRQAQLGLAITAFTVVLWITRAVNNGIASVVMMALLVLVGVRPGLALSGFATPGLWILLCALFYGFAMERTGLAQRISYFILSLFPATYLGILSAFCCAGFLLALGIPSMTVRTAILVPIAWALVQSLHLEDRSRGNALIVLTTIEMAVVPGLAFLYGSLMGPIVDDVFRAKQFPLSSLSYAQVLAPPTAVLCILIIFINQYVLRPEKPLKCDQSFVRNKLNSLGSIKASEWITGAVVSASICFWATDRIHHLPSFLIGMFGLGVLAFSGIVRDKDIGSGISWPLLLFIGGIFSLTNVVQEYRITDWLAGYLVPVVRSLTFSTLLLLAVLVVATYLMRFIDPSGLLAIPVLFLPIAEPLSAVGLRPLVIVAPLVMGSVPFWLNYQNIWATMGDGMTDGRAFTGTQRLILATVYAIATLIAMLIGTVYWKAIGIL